MTLTNQQLRGKAALRAIASGHSNQFTLGFIGVGYMGSRIAKRLAASRGKGQPGFSAVGFSVVAFDQDRRKAGELAPLGISLAANPRELARDADVILSCLSDDAAVHAVYDGPDGVLANAEKETLIIEMSTVRPDTSRWLYQAGRERGLDVLDVAISGSTPAAEQGALTLLGGGDREAFDAAQPIFREIAAQWFYMGPSGSGTTMKLVVNALLGIGMQAIAEAAAFGEKAGLQRDRLLEVLAQTKVVAPAHVGKIAQARANDYAPQFPVRHMNKDFRLILETAAAVQAPMPATAAAQQVNVSEAAKGNEEDFSAVVRTMELLAGIARY
jgi:3-hydroxyisobutyrate dehydrogenase-like beta-hydroxyacid dehydrogenase